VSAKVKAMTSPCGPIKASTTKIRYTVNPSIGFQATERRFAPDCPKRRLQPPTVYTMWVGWLWNSDMTNVLIYWRDYQKNAAGQFAAWHSNSHVLGLLRIHP
jgi:hypothetical protein